MPDSAPAPRAFRVAYDGRPFAGFQRQPDAITVEGTLFGALEDLGVCTGIPAGYSAAGRTDAGASAIGQTITLRVPEWLTPRAFNGELPEDIRVWAATAVDADFHATHDASSRTYRYYLHAVPRDTADDAVRTAAEQLSGEHDFHNLTPDERGTVRDLEISVTRDDDFLVLDVTAGGFPRHLVRKLAGLLAEVGRGTTDSGRVARVLGRTPIDGPEGVATASAEGLLLRTVQYPDLTFECDRRALTDANEVFTARRVGHATRERVARELLAGIGDARD